MEKKINLSFFSRSVLIVLSWQLSFVAPSAGQSQGVSRISVQSLLNSRSSRIKLLDISPTGRYLIYSNNDLQNSYTLFDFYSEEVRLILCFKEENQARYSGNHGVTSKPIALEDFIFHDSDSTFLILYKLKEESSEKLIISQLSLSTRLQSINSKLEFKIDDLEALKLKQKLPLNRGNAKYFFTNDLRNININAFVEESGKIYKFDNIKSNSLFFLSPTQNINQLKYLQKSDDLFAWRKLIKYPTTKTPAYFKGFMDFKWILKSKDLEVKNLNNREYDYSDTIVCYNNSGESSVLPIKLASIFTGYEASSNLSNKNLKSIPKGTPFEFFSDYFLPKKNNPNGTNYFTLVQKDTTFQIGKLFFNINDLKNSLSKKYGFTIEKGKKNSTRIRVICTKGNLIHCNIIGKNYNAIFSWDAIKNDIVELYKSQKISRRLIINEVHADDSAFYFVDLIQVPDPGEHPNFSKQEVKSIFSLHKCDLVSGDISQVGEIERSTGPIGSTINYFNSSSSEISYLQKENLLVIFLELKSSGNYRELIIYDLNQGKSVIAYRPTQIHPLHGPSEKQLAELERKLSKIFESLPFDNSLKDELDVISRIIETEGSSNKRNNVLVINTRLREISLLSSHWVFELNYDNRKFNLTKIDRIEGFGVNVMKDRKLLVRNSAQNSSEYYIYSMFPFRKVMEVRTKPNSIRFNALNGYFTELFSYEADNNSVIESISDIKNRPDSILKLLNIPNQSFIKLYSIAADLFKSRFPYNGYDQMGNRNFSILNLNEIKKVISDKGFVSFDCKVHNNYQIRITVNGVELPDQKTKIITSEQNFNNHLSTVPLSLGKNEIEFFCIDSTKVLSRAEKIIVYYNPKEKPKSIMYFLGIGNSKYLDTSRNLNSSIKDIMTLYNIFKGIPNFNLIDTVLNSKNFNPDSLSSINLKLRNTTVNDKVVIFLSGHGLLSEDKKTWYFALYNTSFERPDSSKTITFKDLEQLFDNVPARQRLILIDACHAGNSFFDYKNERYSLLRNRNIEFIYSQNPQLDIKDSDNNPKKDSSISKELSNEPKFNFIDIDNFSNFRPASNFVSLEYDAFKIITQFYQTTIQNGTTIITASRGEQFAKEDNENGFFTREIVDFFSSNLGNSITVKDLLNHLVKRFEKEYPGSGQIPSLKAYNRVNNWMIK